MTNPANASPEKVTQSPSSPVVAGDVESRSGAPGAGTSNILRRWEREDLRKKVSLISRGFGFVFSAVAFAVMASNQHGDWKDFDKYEEYRYVLAIAIVSTLYTGFQTFKQFRELSTGREVFGHRNMVLVDFIGDQIVAYLLISAASAAVPLTNRMRTGSDNIFTDSSAAAISMEFMAFLALAVSALISGYKLSNKTYI